MEINKYQELALVTASDSEDKNLTKLAVLALGLTGEAGEFADHVKKVLGHGHDLDEQYLAKELGDILWYVAVAADYLDISLDRVAQKNIDKLKKRYPEGFSTKASRERRDVDLC